MEEFKIIVSMRFCFLCDGSGDEDEVGSDEGNKDNKITLVTKTVVAKKGCVMRLRLTSVRFKSLVLKRMTLQRLMLEMQAE